MQSGLYVTLSAQVALERRLTTLAANIANQSTPGYRAEEVDFKTLVSRAGGTPVAYVSPGDTYISPRPGVPIKTDNPLDVAVQGDGWLALRTKAGIVVYTRDGRMRMQPGGELQSVNGYTVLDAGNGPIALDPLGGPATIAQDGMITQGGRQIGAIGLFSYVREDGGAPMVVSKGKDFIALKIREIAEQHSIPIVEDKSLARSMYDGVGVDRPIPPEFYKAIAEIIHILYAKGTPKAYAK
jgi:type III secretion system FlhB-like substrate exporter